VHECAPAVLDVVFNPKELVVSKSAVTNHMNIVTVEPTLSLHFISSLAAACPILDYELLNSTTMERLSSADVNLITLNNPTVWRLDIRNDETYSVSVTLKALLFTTSNTLDINIRICGSEQLELVSTEKRRYVTYYEDSVAPNLPNSQKYY
jgi:hypothetical protein